MTDNRFNHKIASRHLCRRAIVYLRQSSERQVQQNLESQRLQYALADRARALGFAQVEVVDSDLGCSASLGAAPREGFDRLIAAVALGEVGIVLSREVSRLSRTDKDWCQLLEVCQVFDTLVADVEQVYDLSLLDDQLVLGIKGTLSVVELKTLQLRMQHGMDEKARRGELMRLMPPGYVVDKAGQVVKDPDRRVQQAIALVFRKFRELWSIRQTFKWFHDEGVELPVNKSVNGQMEIVWQLPTHSFIGTVLSNPFYAGAYVYGRRETQTSFEDGKLVKRVTRVRDAEECRVFIQEHHEGYIDWETYQENRRRIRRNLQGWEKDESVASVRAGHGLLVGLLRCRRCGRKLHVRYWGKSGTHPRYLCAGDYEHGGEYCLSFAGRKIDKRFGEELVRVLSPVGVRASLEALERVSTARDERREALLLQIEQREYDARRAFEQYDEVDPRNRLVASELERRWNAKLEQVDSARQALEQIERTTRSVTEEELEAIRKLGQHFGDVWSSVACPMELKKKIARTVIEEVLVDLDDETQRLQFVIHWKGGTHTELELDKPRSPVGQKTSEEDLDIIRRMGLRYGDDQIAYVLNRLGRSTQKGKRWNEQRVYTARRNHRLAGQRRAKPDPEILSLRAAASYCEVSECTIKRLVASGHLEREQVAPWAPWEIRRSDLDAEPVRGIVRRLRETGKLVLEGRNSLSQTTLL